MDFQELINQYLCGNIDMHKFYILLKKLYNSLLTRKKFLEVQYLKIYPFFNDIQDTLDEDNLERVVRKIKKIMEGEADYVYNVWLGLRKDDMDDIDKIWMQYKKDKKISLEGKKYLENKLQCGKFPVINIVDICMGNLITLLNELLWNCEIQESCMLHTNLLYAGEGIDFGVVNEKIENLISSLKGNKPIYVTIRYVKGQGNVLLL